MATMELDGRPIDPLALASLALYNYGHFTSILVDDGRVKGLDLHLQRLRDDCRTLFHHDLDTERVRKLVRQAGTGPSTVVRVTVFSPDLELGSPGREVEPRVLVTTRPVAYSELPPLRLSTVAYQREMPTIKHVGLFGTVARRRTAQLQGFDDVVFLDRDGRLTEGATWNVGFVDRGGRVVWPNGDLLIGVTMRLLQDQATHATADIDLSVAREMVAAFATNAAIGIRRIESIDSINFPANSPVVRSLQQSYAQLIPNEL